MRMANYVQIIYRIIITYIVLLTITRLMGKREISQFSYFDYVIGITIGSISANLIVDGTKSIVNIFIILFVFCFLQIFSSYISLKNISFRKITTGAKTMLIKNGKVIEKNLIKERLNIDELSTKLREKNVFNLADVEFAFLEIDGNISVQKKPNIQPLTPSHLKLPTTYTGIGDFIIREGEIQEEVLRRYGLTRSWLMSKLGEKEVFDLSKVIFAQVDENGRLFIDLYDDYEDHSPKNATDEILLAKLNKVHSDLLAFYAEVDDESTKIFYKNCAENIQHVTQFFHSYLREQSNKNEMLNSPKS